LCENQDNNVKHKCDDHQNTKKIAKNKKDLKWTSQQTADEIQCMEKGSVTKSDVILFMPLRQAFVLMPSGPYAFTASAFVQSM
jgi:hypothetical protein